jgi:hypothetical protein
VRSAWCVSPNAPCEVPCKVPSSSLLTLLDFGGPRSGKHPYHHRHSPTLPAHPTSCLCTLDGAEEEAEQEAGEKKEETAAKSCGERREAAEVHTTRYPTPDLLHLHMRAAHLRSAHRLELVNALHGRAWSSANTRHSRRPSFASHHTDALRLQNVGDGRSHARSSSPYLHVLMHHYPMMVAAQDTVSSTFSACARCSIVTAYRRQTSCVWCEDKVSR